MEITVPSNHTKYSLLGNFPALNPGQIKILYSPIKELPPASETRHKSQRPDKYSVQSRDFFLVTSARRWVKNAYRAVKAFDELFSTFEGIEKKVLVLGVHENSRLGRGLANPDRFVFRGYVPAEDLNLLYRQAFAFVYPTLNEGFGYPPLESMRYGTPVLAAATSAVTEICGDAVLYFNPLDEGEIKNRALSILFDEEIWKRYSKKGRQRFEMIKERQEHMLDELCDLILGRC
jgi:glycosyltransferase involved in cell wall biosynthesis